MDYYKKTQYGSLLIGFCLFSAGVIYSFDGPSDEFLYTLFILGAVIAVFGTLTVSIDRAHLKIRLGVGLFRRTIPLKEIREVTVSKIPWWLGSGIRWYRGKMIYNVSGLQALEITLENNKMILLGTSEPNLLKQKIDTAKGLF